MNLTTLENAVVEIQGSPTTDSDRAHTTPGGALDQITNQGQSAPQQPVTPWLTDDGTLNVNVPTRELLSHVLATQGSPERLEELARLFCDDVYEAAGTIYDSSDAYYACKELKRDGLNNDIDHDDLADSSRSHIHDNISTWLDETAALVVQRLQAEMGAGISNTDEAADGIEDYVTGEFRSYALTIMDKVAREWYD